METGCNKFDVPNFLGVKEVTFGGLLVLLVKNNRELPTTNLSVFTVNKLENDFYP